MGFRHIREPFGREGEGKVYRLDVTTILVLAAALRLPVLVKTTLQCSQGGTLSAHGDEAR